MGSLEEGYVLILNQFFTTISHENQISESKPKSFHVSLLSLYSSSIEESLKVEEENQMLQGSTQISWIFHFNIWFLSLLGFLSPRALSEG